jgi:hypothetical protein
MMTPDQRELFIRIHTDLTATVEREGPSKDLFIAVLAYAVGALANQGLADHEIFHMTILALEGARYAKEAPPR